MANRLSDDEVNRFNIFLANPLEIGEKELLLLFSKNEYQEVLVNSFLEVANDLLADEKLISHSRRRLIITELASELIGNLGSEG